MVSGPQITPFHAESSAIDGLWVLTMKQIADERGTIREYFRESSFADSPIPRLGPWAQVNVTETRAGIIRGMHGEPTSKLVAAVAGEAFGAYVDTRPGSPTLGAVVTVPLVAGTQVFVPEGVCNGFQALSEPVTQYLYCFTAEWKPGMGGAALTPLGPELGIDWPITPGPDSVSAKDLAAPTLAQYLAELG